MMREVGRGMGVTGRRRGQRYTCFERLNEGEQPFRFDYINFHAVFVSLSSSLSIVFPFENSIVGGEAREGEGEGDRCNRKTTWATLHLFRMIERRRTTLSIPLVAILNNFHIVFVSLSSLSIVFPFENSIVGRRRKRGS